MFNSREWAYAWLLGTWWWHPPGAGLTDTAGHHTEHIFWGQRVDEAPYSMST